MKSYTIYGPEKWESYFTEYVHQYLTTKGYIVFTKNKTSFNLDITDSCPNWYGVLRKNIIFQDNQTKQFFAINHADQDDDISIEIVSHPLCVGTLKCQYRHGSYGEWENKVSAFTYGVKEKGQYFALREKMRDTESSTKQMYFKGNETGRKNILIRLREMGLINNDYGFRDGHGSRKLKIAQEIYLSNMAKSKLILSLPGIGGCCHRELEAFGIGVPVLMPVLVNKYYNQPIPDFHYIAVDALSISGKKIKHYNDQEEKLLCKLIADRYHEVINNDSFLCETSTNAMIWFDHNISFPSNMELMEDILSKEFGYQL